MRFNNLELNKIIHLLTEIHATFIKLHQNIFITSYLIKHIKISNFGSTLYLKK